MMQLDPVILDLKQQLLLLEHSKPISTQSELAAIRCPLCGDSDNIRSAHFYVGVKEINNKQMIVYDCKKCGRSGFVTPSLLRKLNIYDIFIETYLKSTMKGMVKTFGGQDDLSHAHLLFPKITKADVPKIDYLSERLHLDFSSNEMIEKYKIILNLETFLRINHIQNPAVSRDKLPLISKYGIGFLSEDKKSISVRNMESDMTFQSRFNIIHLFQGVRRPFMYIPPCEVDILTPYPKMVLSESSFNIICVKNYFYPDDDSSIIYASSSRKSYSRPILRLIQLSGFTHGQIDIFADKEGTTILNIPGFPRNDLDFDVNWYRDHMARYLDSFDIMIYLNTEEKDFGNMPKEGEKFSYKIIRL
jgi:transcription elongation factor Elf1